MKPRKAAGESAVIVVGVFVVDPVRAEPDSLTLALERAVRR